MQSRTPGFGTALAVSLTLGLTGCAAPEPPPEGVRSADREGDDRLRALDGASRSWALRTFRALDADGDGGLSTAEIDAAPESLAALDGDGDGRLSGGELGLPGGGSVRILARPRPQIPEGTPGIRLDLDAGDTLDIADLPPQFQGLLSSVDADGDGAASAGELLALMGAEAGGPADPEPGSAEGRAAPPLTAGNGGEAPPTAHMPLPGNGGEAPPRAHMPLLLAALDADRDGAVSEAERESAAQSLRALDADGDGRIAPDELRPAAGGGHPRQ